MPEIESIRGDLRAVSQLVLGTFQHLDELSANQIKDLNLLNQWFHVADYPQYHYEGGKSYLALARHTRKNPNNLVLRHLFDKNNSSYNQLTETDNFCPDFDEASTILKATNTLTVKLSDLRLSGDNLLYRCLIVRTADGQIKTGENYDSPSEVEEALLERAGITERFLEVLQNKNINDTQLYFLNPDYVANVASKCFVGRATWRSNFDDNVSSYFIDHSVDGRGHLLGVRSSFKKNLPYRENAAKSKSDLELVLDEFGMDSPYELRKALKLYGLIKNIKA